MSDGIPLIFGILKDFRPNVKELKVFDSSGRQKFDEARDLNDKIMNMKDVTKKNKALKLISDRIFGQGFPMVPFPDVERCLGLQAKDSTMRIQDGYAVLAFDYKVKPSNVNCLFNMKQNIAQKELRMANMNKGMSGFNFDKATKQIQRMAKEFKSVQLPPLPSLDLETLKKIDLNDAMQMVNYAQTGFDKI